MPGNSSPRKLRTWTRLLRPIVHVSLSLAATTRRPPRNLLNWALHPPGLMPRKFPRRVNLAGREARTPPLTKTQIAPLGRRKVYPPLNENVMGQFSSSVVELNAWKWVERNGTEPNRTEATEGRQMRKRARDASPQFGARVRNRDLQLGEEP